MNRWSGRHPSTQGRHANAESIVEFAACVTQEGGGDYVTRRPMKAIAHERSSESGLGRDPACFDSVDERSVVALVLLGVRLGELQNGLVERISSA